MRAQTPTKPLFSSVFRAATVGLTALLIGFSPVPTQAQVFTSISEIDLPVAKGAREPSLFAMNDGRILMSWTEPADTGFLIKTAIGDKTTWSAPQTVVRSDRLFVNWADFANVSAFSDGTLVAQWLMRNGPSVYAYDVNIALSPDEGRSWGDTIVPHRDGTQSEHGFVSLLPLAQGRLLAIWLDGRAYGTGAEGAFANAMQLRATTIGMDGSLSRDTLLDARTCTCCQTAAAITDGGSVLVVYRDRTAGEIRDISLVRLVDGVWSRPATIHADKWEIDGCPVNGPAIDTNGERAVVAWFTGAQDIPVVNLAFSDNTGESFDAPIRVDSGEAAGRVDVLMLGDGSALVSWVEWTEAGEALMVCRALPESGCTKPQVIILNTAAESFNFPRMVLVGADVYIAWTQPLNDYAGQNVTIRMVRARF